MNENIKIDLSYFFGREDELKEINRCYRNGLIEKGNICFVSGKAGVGKTGLIEEFVSQYLTNEVIFVKSRCLRNRNKIPFKPFADFFIAFKELFDNYEIIFQKILSKKIQQNIGNMSEIIEMLHPEMNNLIGKSISLSELEDFKEKKRVLTIIKNLLLLISMEDRPIVLWIEDFENIDFGSIELLNEIIQEVAEYPVFIIASYREEEILDNHFLNKLKINNSLKREIKLENFSNLQLRTYISEILSATMKQVEHTADEIFRLTSGNVLLINEILMKIKYEKLLFFDTEWKIKEKISKHIKPIDILEKIIITRLEIIKNIDRDILEVSSVKGMDIDFEFICKNFEITSKKASQIINKLENLNFLKTNSKTDDISFLHENIQTFIYDNIGEERRQDYHLKIIEFLENSGKIENSIFEIANHSIESEDKKRIIIYGILAGEISKNLYASSEAMSYFEVVKNTVEESKIEKFDISKLNVLENSKYQSLNFLQTLNKNGINIKESIIKYCQNEIGTQFLKIGEYEKAINIFQEMIEQDITKYEKSSLYEKICSAYYKQGDYEKCELYGKIGLGILGEKLILNNGKLYISILKEVVSRGLNETKIKVKIKRKNTCDQARNDLIVNYLYKLCWIYAFSDGKKALNLCLHMMNFCDNNKVSSKEYAKAITIYSGILFATTQFDLSKKYLLKGLRLSGRLKDLTLKAKFYQLLGGYFEFTANYEKALNYATKSIILYRKIGDVWEKDSTLFQTMLYFYHMGRYRACIDISKEIKDEFSKIVTDVLLQRVYVEKGDFELSKFYGKRALKNCIKNKMWQRLCFVYTDIGIMNMKLGRYKKANIYFNKAKQLYEKNRYMKQHVLTLYLGIAELRILEYKNGEVKLGEVKKCCDEALRKSKRWKTHYGAALRLYGIYLKLINKYKKAERYFLQSIDENKAIGRRYELARSYNEYGKFCIEMGRSDEGEKYLKKAEDLFRKL